MNYAYPIPGSQVQPEIFTSDVSGVLGSYDKPLNAKIQLKVDYSLLPVPPLISTFSFQITPGGEPQLKVSAPAVDIISGDALRFVIEGGIAGRTYTMTINVIGSAGGVRSDVLTINVLGDGDCDCQIIQPVVNNGLTSPDGSLFVNTGPRLFVSATPPMQARVMDQWYNSITNQVYINVSDGDTSYWVLMSGFTGSAQPSTQTLYYVASTGQTAFPLSVPDMYGNSVHLIPGMTLSVTKGGLRLVPDAGAGVGGYTVNVASSTVNLLWPAGSGEILTVDVYDITTIATGPQGPPGIAGTVFLQEDVLTVTAPNTLSQLSRTPDGFAFILFVEGRPFFAAVPSPAFTYSGTVVTWVSTLYSLQPGNEVVAVYTVGTTPLPLDWWLTLPTTLPPKAGILWNNGGVICVS